VVSRARVQNPGDERLGRGLRARHHRSPGPQLIFCEVKEKLGERFGDPLEMVDDEKQRRLRLAADAWLARHPEAAGLEVSFDVIAVRSGQLERVAEAF
jgi:Holliday junction resolvase-like predicted endonuclease